MSGRDLDIVGGQLHRAPRAMSQVAVRCPFGFPAVVENLPYDQGARPFPTLYYCTCPSLVAAVGVLESAGGIRSWSRRLGEEPTLMASLEAAIDITRRRRRDLVRRYSLTMIDAGSSLMTGVGGVADVGGVKCLHAHVAHALAHPGYVFGEAVFASVAAPWCEDRRCAVFAAAADPGEWASGR